MSIMLFYIMLMKAGIFFYISVGSMIRHMLLCKCVKFGRSIITFSSFVGMPPFVLLFAIGAMWLFKFDIEFFVGCFLLLVSVICICFLESFFIGGFIWVKDEKVHICCFPHIHAVVNFEELQTYAKEVKPFIYKDKIIIFAAERTIELSVGMVGMGSFVNVLFHRLNWELPKTRIDMPKARYGPQSQYQAGVEEKSAPAIYEYVQMRKKMGRKSKK